MVRVQAKGSVLPVRVAELTTGRIFISYRREDAWATFSPYRSSCPNVSAPTASSKTPTTSPRVKTSSRPSSAGGNVRGRGANDHRESRRRL
jgi:hypothetical protein